MPQQPVGPVAAKKRPRSSERLRSMLTPAIQSPGGARPFDGPTPSSLKQYAMRDYRYNPENYTPEELAQYQQFLDKNIAQDLGFPYQRTDLTGDYYRKMRDYPVMYDLDEGRPMSPDQIGASQDSLYSAARLAETTGAKNSEEVRRREILNATLRKIAPNWYGEK